MNIPRVLCLGEVLYDFLADQLGVPLEAVKSWTPYPGGAPANVACGLAKLGTPSAFIGCVGRDHLGKSLVDTLDAEDVDVRGVQWHETAPTRSVYVVRSTTGERSFAGFGDHATTEFADTRLQANGLRPALFESAEYLVLGTLELAYPDSRAAIYRALELADQFYVKILVDINWRPVFWDKADRARAEILDILSRIDFLKVSDEEAEWLFQTTDPSEIAQTFDQLEGVIITAGDRGCRYYLNGFAGMVPAFSVDVEDTTGAGDGFVAGFVHQLCRRGAQSLSDVQAIGEILRYANAVGGLTATQAGAISGLPTALEVEAFFYLKRQAG